MMIGGEEQACPAARSDLRDAGARHGRYPAHAGTRERRTAPPSRATCTAARTAPATSSRWFTTASSTASWPPMPKGLGVLRAANIGKQQHAIDAETTPLRDPEHYQYDLNLRDIAEVWRRGSVIASWLLDLTATALARRSGAGEVRGPCFGLRRRAAGRSRPPSTRRCRRPCSPPRSTSASARAARRISKQAAIGDALRVRRTLEKVCRKVRGSLMETSHGSSSFRRPGVFRCNRRSCL